MSLWTSSPVVPLIDHRTVRGQAQVEEAVEPVPQGDFHDLHLQHDLTGRGVQLADQVTDPVEQLCIHRADHDGVVAGKHSQEGPGLSDLVPEHLLGGHILPGAEYLGQALEILFPECHPSGLETVPLSSVLDPVIHLIGLLHVQIFADVRVLVRSHVPVTLHGLRCRVLHAVPVDGGDGLRNGHAGGVSQGVDPGLFVPSKDQLAPVLLHLHHADDVLVLRVPEVVVLAEGPEGQLRADPLEIEGDLHLLDIRCRHHIFPGHFGKELEHIRQRGFTEIEDADRVGLVRSEGCLERYEEQGRDKAEYREAEPLSPPQE